MVPRLKTSRRRVRALCVAPLTPGRKRIQLICNQMGILPSVQRGAQRFYSLAVDNKFNRGRRTDYVVASCIYLYSRFEKDALMLIDFSERLQVSYEFLRS